MHINVYIIYYYIIQIVSLSIQHVLKLKQNNDINIIMHIIN